MLGYQISILVVLLAFSGIFSGIETALMAISSIKVKSLLNQKKPGSASLFRIKQNTRKLITTILLCNNVVNISSATLATVIFTELLGDSGLGVATGVMTFLILVFGEITPKTYAVQHAEKISLAVAKPIEILTYMLLPLVKILEGISYFISKLLHSTDFQEELTEEDIRTIVTMGRKQGILQKQAAEMMRNLMDFKVITIAEIMTPRRDIIAIQGSSKLKDVIGFVVKKKYTKYPVFYRGKLSRVIDIEDVLKYAKANSLDANVSEIARHTEFVYETDKAKTLLHKWQGKRDPLALVKNKEENVSGLITLEDIIESIVGEIFDKTKKHRHVQIKRLDSKHMMVGANVSVEEISDILHLGIRTHHFETLAGFVKTRMGKVKKGATLELSRVKLEVIKIKDGSIDEIRVTKR